MMKIVGGGEREIKKELDMKKHTVRKRGIEWLKLDML